MILYLYVNFLNLLLGMFIIHLTIRFNITFNLIIMAITKQQMANICATIFLCIFLVFIGFYFGFKTAKAQMEVTTTKEEIGKIADKLTSKPEVAGVTAKEVDGVYWIKANSEPNCPDDYPIKGTFSANNGNYMTKTYKGYEKTRPDICFATEEYARDSAGFIKKF
jgi:hypothetical protein